MPKYCGSHSSTSTSSNSTSSSISPPPSAGSSTIPVAPSPSPPPSPPSTPSSCSDSVICTSVAPPLPRDLPAVSPAMLLTGTVVRLWRDRSLMASYSVVLAVTSCTGRKSGAETGRGEGVRSTVVRSWRESSLMAP
ncbi:unnamed protein product [Closterium sp. NIES-54]